MNRLPGAALQPGEDGARHRNCVNGLPGTALQPGEDGARHRNCVNRLPGAALQPGEDGARRRNLQRELSAPIFTSIRVIKSDTDTETFVIIIKDDTNSDPVPTIK